MGNVQITGLSLFPLSADLQVDYVFKNPSDIEFNVNSIKADILVESGSTVYSIGEIDVSDKVLTANGYVTIPATFHLSSDVITFLSEHSTGYDLLLSGKSSVSGKYFILDGGKRANY